MGERRGVLQGNSIDLTNLYIGLAHYPVYDKRGRVVCSAVTNLDIHDLARCASTFGVRIAYIINPLDSQRRLAERIIHHWTRGGGADHNPDRKHAFHRVRVKATLAEVIQEISGAHRLRVRTVATGASRNNTVLSYRQMREFLLDRLQPYLLVFGTGWGLTRDVLESSDHVLAPIEGVRDYNHLSVRSAAAIILDRLMGNR
jgi:hypothetical protein